jgi:DNA-binding MarR family transcriptional regulator
MHLQPLYMHISMSTLPQPRKTVRTDAATLVDACSGLNSRLAARRITQFLDREMAATGLAAAQIGLMAQIAVASDDTLGGLAQRAGLDQSTLSRNLRTLQAAGLVEIAMAGADQRRRMAWLTEAGVRQLEAALPIWRRAQAKLARQLSPALARNLADASAALVAE